MAYRPRPVSTKSRKILPLIDLPAKEQFRQNISRLIVSTMSLSATSGATDTGNLQLPVTPGLRKLSPYWYPYTTYAKQRWIGRELLEVISTEFRDRSVEYYRYALESGVTTVNGHIANPETIIIDGDLIENVVHRHEPPVTSTPVRVLHEDKERQFIVVDKPGSIPVHPAGRYFRNTLVEILMNEFGYEKVYSVNRLDRLTSGLMILPTGVDLARKMTAEFTAGTVRKVYVARANGRFPEGELVCEEPLLTIDRQMGLNIVHPEGKPAKTVFELIRYDAESDTSVVLCKPFTGRSHQIRVHLQYLGHPISNDPVYSEPRIWGESLGKGGIDLVPSEERSAPAPPEHLAASVANGGNPEAISSAAGEGGAKKLMPRETGQDIGMGTHVPLSSEAVGIITRLRNMKDENEDWSRWRDVVFRAKGALFPSNLNLERTPPKHIHGKHKGRGRFKDPSMNEQLTRSGSRSPSPVPMVAETPEAEKSANPISIEAVNTSPVSALETRPPSPPPQLSTDEVLKRVAEMEPAENPIDAIKSEHLYCPDCYLPLHPDPKPEKLYIFLHALQYTTSLGTFKTEMPEWSHADWKMSI